jgi:DNA-binding Lrp family transcriptional regulator
MEKIDNLDRKILEIIMKNGKVYRIGTDVPEELEMAIKRVINH